MTTARDLMAKAMEAKRRELIALPLARIWPELAQAAIDAFVSAPESVRLELAALLNPWREIETATDEDKDGFVLGFVAGTKLPMVAVWNDADNRWFALNDAFNEDWNPTHYKPLPAPPLEEKK